MQKIKPCLWFNDQAEDAVSHYTSIFKNSRISTVTHYSADGAKASGRPQGSVMTIAFELDGQEFLALNGGPIFKFTPAISLIVNCETQAELDQLYERLAEGGEVQPCGWLTDKYGLSWQLVPSSLERLMHGGDTAKSAQVMQALLQMKKLDIKTLQEAYER